MMPSGKTALKLVVCAALAGRCLCAGAQTEPSGPSLDPQGEPAPPPMERAERAAEAEDPAPAAADSAKLPYLGSGLHLDRAQSPFWTVPPAEPAAAPPSRIPDAASDLRWGRWEPAQQ